MDASKNTIIATCVFVLVLNTFLWSGHIPSSIPVEMKLVGKENNLNRRDHPAGPPPKLTKKHRVYKGWQQPIVFEQYKLVFFLVPKVAQTTFLQLFLRMLNSSMWNTTDTQTVHNTAMPLLQPHKLGSFKAEKAQEIMTSPNYTRAIFVRDPAERLLSAYLDRVDGFGGTYAAKVCCNIWLPPDRNHWNRTVYEWLYCIRAASKESESIANISATCHATKWQGSMEAVRCISNYSSLERFVDRTLGICPEAHWWHQSEMIDKEFWPYINVVEHLNTASRGVESLLRSIGDHVWEQYGANGWGKFGNESMFQSISTLSHARSAKFKYDKYLNTPGLESKVKGWYSGDYTHPVLGKYFKSN
jgi:hypothetical protein